MVAPGNELLISPAKDRLSSFRVGFEIRTTLKLITFTSLNAMAGVLAIKAIYPINFIFTCNPQANATFSSTIREIFMSAAFFWVLFFDVTRNIEKRATSVLARVTWEGDYTKLQCISNSLSMRNGVQLQLV